MFPGAAAAVVGVNGNGVNVTTTITGVEVAAGGGGVGVSVGGTGIGVLVGGRVVVGVSVAGNDVGEATVPLVGVSIGGKGVKVNEGKMAAEVAVTGGVAVIPGGDGWTAKSTAIMTVKAITISVPAAIRIRCNGEELLFPLKEGSGRDTEGYLINQENQS